MVFSNSKASFCFSSFSSGFRFSSFEASSKAFNFLLFSATLLNSAISSSMAALSLFNCSSFSS